MSWVNDKDKEIKNTFIKTLETLTLKELEEPTFNVGGGLTLNAGNTVSIDPTYFPYQNQSLNVDSEGNALLSDRDIDRIAKRVVDLLKKEGLQ